jgi:Fe-S-cluster containining protein
MTKITSCQFSRRGLLIPFMPIVNPCLKCGACCTFYRVSFYWSEADPSQGGIVPPEFTEPIPPYCVCMRGTNQPHPRCAALRGRIGDLVSCSIYALRPSTCREFGFHYSNSELTIDPQDVERCNHAREACNLPPLKLNNLIRGVHPAALPHQKSHRHRPPMR